MTVLFPRPSTSFAPPRACSRFADCRTTSWFNILGYFEGHFNVYCDDATQNAYHTHSVLDATIASFLEKRPWLASARPSFIQSDNASNYRSPTTEVGVASVGTRCFSEPGMGKDGGGGNGAVIKGKMNRVRDERNGIESMA